MTAGGLEARVAAVLARAVPGFRALRALERLSGGASQETYRVVAETDAGRVAFALRRAPGGAEPARPAGPTLATEARLLEAARAAGVPEPRVVAVLAPEDGLGPGFVMEWLGGETLGPRIVRAPELERARRGLARQCGEILARIHALDLEASGLAAHLPVRTPEACVRETWAAYQAFDTPQPMIDFTARWLLDHLPAEAPLALVHGDFRTGNFVLGQRGIVGVLDWELAHVGDPMRDLGWLCTRSWRFGRPDLPVGGFGRMEDLLAGYEAACGRRVDPERVRFWEVFGSFWWAVGCLEMAHHYRVGPDRSVERAAIGRRTSECQVDCVNLLIPGPVSLPEPAQPPDAELAMPRADELLESAAAFLREDAAEAAAGRARFLARVAANAMDIVRRERTLGPPLRARERERLGALLGAPADEDLASLRRRLCEALRSGALPLDAPGLADALREAVVGQVAIDQPRYPGLREALAHAARRDAGA